MADGQNDGSKGWNYLQKLTEKLIEEDSIKKDNRIVVDKSGNQYIMIVSSNGNWNYDPEWKSGPDDDREPKYKEYLRLEKESNRKLKQLEREETKLKEKIRNTVDKQERQKLRDKLETVQQMQNDILDNLGENAVNIRQAKIMDRVVEKGKTSFQHVSKMLEDVIDGKKLRNPSDFIKEKLSTYADKILNFKPEEIGEKIVKKVFKPFTKIANVASKAADALTAESLDAVFDELVDLALLLI